MFLAAKLSAQTLPWTNQCPCVFGSQQCPPPAQGLPLAGCLAPRVAQVGDKAHRQRAGTRRLLVFEGSWCTPQPCWAELALSQVGTRSGCFKEGRPGGFVKNSPPSWRVLTPGNRHRPPMHDRGEHPQVCLKRQVGRGSAAVEWGAADLTCQLCHVLPRYPGLALVTRWQSGHLRAWMPTGTTHCPRQAVAPGLHPQPPQLMRVRG